MVQSENSEDAYILKDRDFHEEMMKAEAKEQAKWSGLSDDQIETIKGFDEDGTQSNSEQD